MRLSLCALAALAMLPGSAAAGKGGGGKAGNPGGAGGTGGVVLLDGPCVLAIGASCLFDGNINLDNKLALVDAAYNGQAPAPADPLDLTGLIGAEQDSGFAADHSGTVTSSFLVGYYAVKAGDAFRLYEIAPTRTFSWSTSGILNNGGQEPAISHVVWFEAPKFVTDTMSVVPEPASWALTIGGFGLAGAMLRRRRAQSIAS